MGLILASFVLSLGTISAQNSPARKPNVVVVMADDIGLGDIGFYHKKRTGQKPLVPTANIDDLIRSGMRFSDAHSPASLCAPTRFSMLTGNFNYRNKRPWGVWSPWVNTGIDPEYTTIARIAKEGGYATAFFGKWGMGGLWEAKYNDYSKFNQIEGGAAKYGFDYSLVLPQGIQNEPYAFYENGKWMKLKGNSELVHIPFEQTQYDKTNRNKNRDGVGDSNWDPSLAGRILANKAVKYINKQAKKEGPFYLYYCSQAVHVPHTPTKKLNRTKIAGTTLGPHGDMIKELDAQIGLIVKTLKKSGEFANTLFVFTSDNGGLNRDQHLRAAGHDSSNGLTGQKGSIYEGGHRVPFVAVWSGVIEPGSESAVTIVGHDMVATLAAIAQVELEPSKVLDSGNLLPVFIQKSTKPLHKYILHQSQSRGGPYYALREGDWKLIFKAKAREQFDNMERIGFYNLKTHTAESTANNLLDHPEQQDRIKKMHQTYLEFRQQGAATAF